MADEVTSIPVAESAAPVAAVVSDASTALPSVEASTPAIDAPAVAVEAPVTESQPSLLEAAAGKPKADEAKAEVTEASPEPAPADADKVDAKEVKAEGDKKPEAKADEAKPDADKATDPVKDATAEAQPPAPVKYEAFKLPDGVRLDEKELGKFTELAGVAQVPQETAQKMIDLYLEDRQNLYQQAATEQRRVWNTLNDGWKTDLRKDSVLGGNRLETSLSMAKAVVEEYGGSPEQVRDLLAHTSNNGMGNYPGFVRLLHNIGVAMNVFEDSMVPANPSAQKAEKGPGKRGWYPSMGNGQST